MQGPAAQSSPPAIGRQRYRGLIAALHIFGLAGLAFAQPLFDLLGRQVDFLVAHDARPLDLIFIVLLVSVGVPVFLVLMTGTVTLLNRPVGKWVYLAWVAILASLIVLPPLGRLAPAMPGLPLVGVAAVLGLVFSGCYHQWSGVRSFLSFVSPIAVLSPLLFLLASPVRHMLLPQSGSWTAGLGGNRTPVVMMIMDEFPLSSLLDESYRIDPVRYPNFAKLAEGAYWFRDATTVAGSTAYSIPIILSGRIPDKAMPPLPESYPDNLFTWLASAGYRLHVVENNTRICPRDLCGEPSTRRSVGERFDAMVTDLGVIYLHLLAPTDLAKGLPTIEATWRDFTPTIGSRVKGWLGRTPETSDAEDATPPKSKPFDVFLASIGRDDQPSLHFLHLMQPHVPWKYLPSGKQYGPVPTLPQGVVKEFWGDNEWQVVQGLQRHLLQVGYLDRLIGQLIERLKEHDLYESALIVLVADHGAAFEAGAPRRRSTARRFSEILNIPLLVKLPNQQEGVVSDRNVETIDVLPTIADVLDLQLPWASDGQSAIDFDLPERSEKFSIIKGGERFARRPRDIAAFRAERERHVSRKLELFGSGTGSEALFRIGRHLDLLGRRPGEIGISGDAERGADVRLANARFFGAVDLEESFIPARVSGRAQFASPRGEPMELAVVVNNKVEALTETFRQSDQRGLFTAMVPETAFQEGHNRVEIFEIRGPKESRVLVPTQPSTRGYSLEATDGSPGLRSPDGSVIPVVEGYLRGKGKLRQGSKGVQLSGWAMAPGSRQAAEILVVFIDGRSAVVTDNGLRANPRRGQAKKKRRAQSSFRIRLPQVDFERIRLFAILGESATEIVLEPA